MESEGRQMKQFFFSKVIEKIPNRSPLKKCLQSLSSYRKCREFKCQDLGAFSGVYRAAVCIAARQPHLLPERVLSEARAGEFRRNSNHIAYLVAETRKLPYCIDFRYSIFFVFFTCSFFGSVNLFLLTSSYLY